MRTTKTQLTKTQAIYTKQITEEKDKAVNPETKDKVSIDFSKDLFSLLDTLNPHKNLKDFTQLDSEIADGYVRKKFTHYGKVVKHYGAIRKFLQEFSRTRLYQHLQSLNNPEQALQILLDMFSPPPKKEKSEQQKQQQGGQQGQQEQKDGEKSEGKGEGENKENKQKQEGKGEGKEEQEKEQSGNSQGQKGGGKTNENSQGQNSQGSPDNQKPNSQEPEEMDTEPENEMSNTSPAPMMDMNKFNDLMPKIEQALEKNILDDDLMKKVIGQQAGTDHNALKTIEGLADNIEKVTEFIENENFKILNIARKFGVTEQYQREEDVADVNYPEKDWRVTNMKTLSDLPQVLPYQYLYPDAIFDKMLFDKDLKIKQYQSRRKKKQILYILIDGSGSMGRLEQITSSGIAIAYLRKAIEEGSKYFFRYFDTEVFELHKVTNEKEAIKEIDYLLNNHHSGGGTRIDSAIRHAIEDINNPALFKQDPKDKNSDLYDRADILVITDGEDRVDITSEFLKEKKVTLHSFLLNSSNPELEKISKSCQNLTKNEMNNLFK